MGFIRFGVKSVLELKLSTFVGQEILVEHQEKDRVMGLKREKVITSLKLVFGLKQGKKF